MSIRGRPPRRYAASLFLCLQGIASFASANSCMSSSVASNGRKGVISANSCSDGCWQEGVMEVGESTILHVPTFLTVHVDKMRFHPDVIRIQTLPAVADMRMPPEDRANLDESCRCVISANSEGRCENDPVVLYLVRHHALGATWLAIVVVIKLCGPANAVIKFFEGHVRYPCSVKGCELNEPFEQESARCGVYPKAIGKFFSWPCGDESHIWKIDPNSRINGSADERYGVWSWGGGSKIDNGVRHCVCV